MGLPAAHFLENDAVTIGGVRFVGAVLSPTSGSRVLRLRPWTMPAGAANSYFNSVAQPTHHGKFFASPGSSSAWALADLLWPAAGSVDTEIGARSCRSKSEVVRVHCASIRTTSVRSNAIFSSTYPLGFETIRVLSTL